MDWRQILDELTVVGRGYPVAAAQAVLDVPAHYERMVAELERVSAQPAELRDSMFHLHAMHLLAQRRDTRALRPMLAIAALPEAELDAALGDHLTESFKNCIAAVCDDEAVLRAFVEDRRHSEWARIVMIDALTLPVFAGDREAAPLLAWLVDTGDRTLAWLKAQHESDDTSAEAMVMDGLAGAVAEIGGQEHLETLRCWWDSGWLDPQVADWDWYETEVNRPWAERRQRFDHYHESYVPDAIGLMQRWYCWSDRFHDARERPLPVQRPVPPARRPTEASPLVALELRNRSDRCWGVVPPGLRPAGRGSRLRRRGRCCVDR